MSACVIQLQTDRERIVCTCVSVHVEGMMGGWVDGQLVEWWVRWIQPG